MGNLTVDSLIFFSETEEADGSPCVVVWLDILDTNERLRV